MKLINNDCIIAMKEMPDNSVDSIVTDPPYELGFMGKSWDSSGIAFNVEVWQEALRVLKPGGHLIAFSGSRTYHRMAVAIEDAGFEIRDQIMWVYGSGFPKSHNVSKGIDKRGGNGAKLAFEIGEALRVARESRGISKAKADEMFCDGTTNWTWFEGRPAGQRPPTPETFARIVEQWSELASLAELVAEAEREVVGVQKNAMAGWSMDGTTQFADRDITAPATPAAKQWDGWGTALKPAHEPMVLARKPLIGTVANNVLTYGTGGLNIDASRVGSEGAGWGGGANNIFAHSGNGVEQEQYVVKGEPRQVLGRWPANFIHDGSDEVVDLLGEPARFFYCAKASKRDRNEGLEGFEAKRDHDGREDGNPGGSNPRNRTNSPKVNHHPTVKPTLLMQYLVRLITPPNGTVLDPFMGSGSTGKACAYEGFDFIGIDQSAEYVEIAQARIDFAMSETLPLELEQETGESND